MNKYANKHKELMDEIIGNQLKFNKHVVDTLASLDPKYRKMYWKTWKEYDYKLGHYVWKVWKGRLGLDRLGNIFQIEKNGMYRKDTLGTNFDTWKKKDEEVVFNWSYWGNSSHITHVTFSWTDVEKSGYNEWRMPESKFKTGTIDLRSDNLKKELEKELDRCIRSGKMHLKKSDAVKYSDNKLLKIKEKQLADLQKQVDSLKGDI